jgi:hypothetical protein
MFVPVFLSNCSPVSLRMFIIIIIIVPFPHSSEHKFTIINFKICLKSNLNDAAGLPGERVKGATELMKNLIF